MRPNWIQRNPYLYILGSYLLAIFIGGAVLCLPVSYTHGNAVKFIDGLFISTSALCVTGLAVFDIGTVLTTFGQMWVLFLIELGGMGIVIVSSVIFLLVRKEFTLLDQQVLQESLTYDRKIKTQKIVLYVVLITIIIEILGAVCLFFCFKDMMPTGRAWYFAFFHSISAFCNAGFALFGNNLESYSAHAGISITIMSLIVIGGIGYFVVIESLGNLRRNIFNFKKYKLSLHSKSAYLVTFILIVGGALAIYLLEYHRLMSKLSFGHGVLASLFQSVTTRTAGFSTLPIGDMTNSTLLIMIILMYIGASPASTGGGIKTTTALVMVKYFIATFKNRDFVFSFKRTIPRDIVKKTIVLIFISFLWVIVATLLVASYEDNFNLAHKEFRLVDYAFEVVSALGTVGLSTGITASLSTFSKAVIIATMYFGRTGFLTLISFLAFPISGERYRYPEEDIFVG